MRPKACITAVVWFLAVVSQLGGATTVLPPYWQTPGGLVESGQRQSPQGATLRGTVTAMGSAQPIARAQVRVVGGQVAAVVTADAQGRFEVTQLAAGRYRISAGKSGFADGWFGQRTPTGPGTYLEVASGQLSESINIALAKGGAIDGVVADQWGDPLSGVLVTAMRYSYTARGRRLSVVPAEGGATTSDDRGVFRLFNLPSGEYVVSAAPKPDGSVSSTPRSSGAAATFFPGTTSAYEAQSVSVRSGQGTVLAPFALVAARLVNVSGRVVSTGNPTANLVVSLFSKSGSGLAESARPPFGRVGGDGAFELAGVPPGDYLLVARAVGPDMIDGLYGRLDLGRVTEDMEGLFVPVGPAGVLTGRVASDDASGVTPRNDEIRVVFEGLGEGAADLAGARAITPRPDLTFEARGVIGRVRIRATVTGPNARHWTTRTVLAGGLDITDVGADVSGPGSTEDIVIVLSRTVTELTGTVTDAAGRPVTDAWIVVVPERSELRLNHVRWLRAVRPDTNGAYSVRGLPPEENYFAFAATDLEEGQWFDPSVLDTIAARGARVLLRDGQQVEMALRASALQR